MNYYPHAAESYATESPYSRSAYPSYKISKAASRAAIASVLKK